MGQPARHARPGTTAPIHPSCLLSASQEPTKISLARQPAKSVLLALTVSIRQRQRLHALWATHAWCLGKLHSLVLQAITQMAVLRRALSVQIVNTAMARPTGLLRR